MDTNLESITSMEERRPNHYTKHHMSCSGDCGYCRQLKEEAIAKEKELKGLEARFTWDEPSTLI